MRTITKVVKIVGLSRRMIQEYENAGVAIKPPKRNKYGYLIYDDDCMNRLWQIRFYKEIGYKKDEMLAIFQSPDYNNAEVLDTQIKLLEQKKREIENLIDVAKLMRETGITPLSLRPQNLMPEATFNDTLGFLGAIARQTRAVEQNPAFSGAELTDEQETQIFEALEYGVSLYKEGCPHDDEKMQTAVKAFHVAAKPVLSDSVTSLFLVAYLITPGSEGAKALEEEYELPGLAEYLQLAVSKYVEDNIDSGSEKLVYDLLDEIVSLGKQKLKSSSPEVQSVVSKIFEYYNEESETVNISPINLMRATVDTFNDPGFVPTMDKILNAKGACKYIAAAIKYYCDRYEDNL